MHLQFKQTCICKFLFFTTPKHKHICVGILGQKNETYLQSPQLLNCHQSSCSDSSKIALARRKAQFENTWAPIILCLHILLENFLQSTSSHRQNLDSVLVTPFQSSIFLNTHRLIERYLFFENRRNGKIFSHRWQKNIESITRNTS